MIVILFIFFIVSNIIRFLLCLSRSSVGSISLNSMFGNFCFSFGISLIGKESCLSSGFPKTRIFIGRWIYILLVFLVKCDRLSSQGYLLCGVQLGFVRV